MRAPRTVLGVAVASLLLAIAAPSLAQEGGEVDVVDSAFEPASVSVDAGATVTWTQTGSLPHTVTADDGSFDSHPDCSGGSDCMAAGDTFAQAFDEPGEYPYYCRIHGGPGGVGMSGVVVVTAAGSTQTPTETATPSETGTPDDGAPAPSGSIEVEDQSGDGTSVTVASVTITGADGFVVIHLDEDGGPGPVIGHVAVDEGTTTELVVPLDQPLEDDATVWPMLHVDAGTTGTYEFPGADVPVSVDGAVVMAPLDLTVTADAATTTEGELADTGTSTTVAIVLALVALVLGAVVLRRSRRRSGTA